MTVKKQRVDKNLELWLEERADADFPGNAGEIYKSRYRLIAGHLAKDVHNQVEKGAIIEAISTAIKSGRCDFDQIPYLNNHGEKHVSTVIQRASELLEKTKCSITPYECYLLLMAIQFHDVGNVWGRDQHEKKCREIIEALGTEAGSDIPERRKLVKIASVHGGLSPNGSRDTISQLLPDPAALMGQVVRYRLLASILRLADELADDSTRTSSLNLVDIPGESIIFHVYSSSLHSVIVNKSDIELNFGIKENDALNQYTSKGTQIFLIDEIYSRTLKMYSELYYCLRFMRPHHIGIDRVIVKISIYPPPTLEEPIKIEYTLQENGYPDHLRANIFSVCPDLEKHTGSHVREQILARRRTS
jgi:hypothetical protein